MPYEFQQQPTQEDIRDYHENLPSQIPTGVGEGLAATLNLGFQSTPLVSLSNLIKDQVNEAKDEPKLSPVELNRQFPHMAMPFSEPLPMSVARDMAERQDYKARLSNVSNNSSNYFGSGITRFAASMIPQMLDPLNIASFGAARAGAGALGLLTAAKSGGVLMNAAVGAGEAAAGLAIPEAINQAENVHSHEEGGLEDYFSSLAQNAALVGAGHGAFKFLMNRAGGKPAAIAQKSAIAQAGMDQKINVDPILAQATGELNGALPEGMSIKAPPYSYTPLNTNELVSGDFYHGSENSMGDLKTVDKPVLENDFGKGIYLTDNPVVANGVAASGFADADGKVIQAKLEGARLLDLERPLQEAERSAIERAIGESLPTDLKGKEIYQALSSEELAKADEALKSLGYDGIRHEGGQFLGADNNPHNIVKLFDEENPKLSEKAQFEANHEATNQPSNQDVKALGERLQEPSNHVLYDEEAYNQFKEMSDHPFEGDNLESLRGSEKEILEDMDTLSQQGHFDPDTQKVWDAIKEEMKLSEKEDSAFKGMMNCLIGNG